MCKRRRRIRRKKQYYFHAIRKKKLKKINENIKKTRKMKPKETKLYPKSMLSLCENLVPITKRITLIRIMYGKEC